MTGSRWGWRAEIVQEPMRDANRLFIFRYVGGSLCEALIGSDVTFQQFDQLQATPDGAGILLPQDSWRAITEIVDPAPNGAEVRRLEEALATERQRVDAFLGRAEIHRTP